jgi:hypothetical protein
MNGLALAAALALAQAPAAPEPVLAASPAPDPATATTSAPRRSAERRPPTATAGRAPSPTDREEAERVARAFLEALARGDAQELARAASDPFSFDGNVQAGRENVRGICRELLASRQPGRAPAVGAVEVLHAADAAARYGRPPARLAPLVRDGVLIAIGDVGGRTVVLFVAGEGGRLAVLGMHD